jgi:hypothetical protein
LSPDRDISASKLISSRVTEAESGLSVVNVSRLTAFVARPVPKLMFR